MKKILYTMMGVGMLFAATSCEDFLDTSSPSEADVDFVFSEASTARAALYNAYEKWREMQGYILMAYFMTWWFVVLMQSVILRLMHHK